MRPIYETGSDVAREAAIAALVAERYGATAKKLPARYCLDHAFMRGDKLVGLAEIKCRKNPSTRYPTLMVSLLKWMTARDVAKAARVPGFLVVSWTDRVGMISVDADDIVPGVGGRTDRGDADDVELVVHIPVSKFRIVSESRSRAA